MRILTVLALALGLPFGTALAAPAYPPVDVEVRSERLGSHSHYIPGLAGTASTANQGFMSNAGFVVTADGVVVFDTLGSPSLAAAMVERIREITPLPIRIAILSHYHADHYYGMQVFQEQGAEVWAHEGGRPVIGSEGARLRFEQRQEILGRWINPTTQRFPQPDLWLSSDRDFSLGGVSFKLRHVGPAHSDEDLVLFVENDGVLYSGDLIFKGRIPFVGDADSGKWLKALDALIALEPRILVPGHGPASDAPREDLTLTRDYLRFLRAEMRRAVNDMIDFETAYEQVDWSAWEKLPAFREANRRNAFNTYILMEKESMGR